MYDEAFRPQFHYSPPCRWMNDPNGLVYYQGEYHLFYQFHPFDTVWGPMHWGHAISSDLIHWQTLPIALYPDELGAIWSGSVVVDAHNTSGLVAGGGLVAIFSYQNQTQGIAFSTDAGRTWQKYAGNPVLPAFKPDFRDPKVSWHEASQRWIMPIAAGREIQFFTSLDLITWEFATCFSGGLTSSVWEVPDLFPLTIKGATKWVLLVSVSDFAPAGGNGIQYFVGEFDGQTFTADDPDTILWLDYGPDNYAGTTWNNTAADKRIYIGWMNNWKYANIIPTSTWRGATTLPRELTLVETVGGLRLAQNPIELDELRRSLGLWQEMTVKGEQILDELHCRTMEIVVDFEVKTASKFGLVLHAGNDEATHIYYDCEQSKLIVNRSDQTDQGTIANFYQQFSAPLALNNNHLQLHLFIDESSVEIFSTDGTLAMTAQTFVNPKHKGLKIFAEDGEIVLSRLEVYALDTIWKDTFKDSDLLSEYPFCQ